MMEDYRIERVRTDDEALRESQQLLRTVFGKRADKYSFEYLKWQYADNPAGEVVGFNAYCGDVLAAHYVTLPVFMDIAGRRTKGLLSCNTATHPDHRGRRLFTILAEHTYNFGARDGYEFVIGVANANSTHGFVKNLGFKLIAPLTFKVGAGMEIYPDREYTYSRHWDGQLMEWRLNNPSMKYYKNGDVIVSPIKPGFKKLVCRNGSSLATLPVLRMRPLNLYIGLGADPGRGCYMNIPGFIERSPFNLIFKDLTGGSLPEMTAGNILFELIDFDVA